tara:strand:+ start:1090 stop:2262 length:1173 start_codon:yes stop_codon:yes gene_type:complete
MKICVVGTGYVGLSLAVLLSQKFSVTALEISKEKVDKINNRISPVKDHEIELYLKNKDLDLLATLDKQKALSDKDYIIIATPTNYNIKTGSFDTSSVESVIANIISINKHSNIVIKSTIPIGFTDRMRNQFNKKEIFFSPEFLRETMALKDNLYPSRVVVGDYTKEATIFAEMLVQCSKKNLSETPVLKMRSAEAEAVKLFSNTFLAMRISFFNELDSFAESNNISTENIISGISSDPRIGNYYNNPSFGYGGYCLPKDTKQLLDNFKNIPNEIIKAIVKSNQTRKEYIVNSIMNKYPKSVGIYRLAMKEGSDNFRESAVLDIIQMLIEKKIKINLYEPSISEFEDKKVELVNDLNQFIVSSDLIIANRLTEELEYVKNKVYSRDIFQEN